MSHCQGAPIASPIAPASHRLDQMAIERPAMARLACFALLHRLAHCTHAILAILRALSALFCPSFELFFTPLYVGKTRPCIK